MSETAEHEAEPRSAEVEGPASDDGLTDAERERRAQALAEVRTFGDPVLRSRASEVRLSG